MKKIILILAVALLVGCIANKAGSNAKGAIAAHHADLSAI